MQSIDLPSNQGPSASVSEAALGAALPVSAGWLVRRAALWMLFVGLGVAGSCLLYMAASKAEGDSLRREQATEMPNSG